MDKLNLKEDVCSTSYSHLIGQQSLVTDNISIPDGCRCCLDVLVSHYIPLPLAAARFSQKAGGYSKSPCHPSARNNVRTSDNFWPKIYFVHVSYYLDGQFVRARVNNN